MQNAGATARACDPEETEQAAKLISDAAFLDDPYQAAAGADAVIVTEWDTLCALRLARTAGVMRTPLAVNLRNV